MVRVHFCPSSRGSRGETSVSQRPVPLVDRNLCSGSPEGHSQRLLSASGPPAEGGDPPAQLHAAVGTEPIAADPELHRAIPVSTRPVSATRTRQGRVQLERGEAGQSCRKATESACTVGLQPSFSFHVTKNWSPDKLNVQGGSGTLQDGPSRPPSVEETFRHRPHSHSHARGKDVTHPAACSPRPRRLSPPAFSRDRKRERPLLGSEVWPGDPCRNQT